MNLILRKASVNVGMSAIADGESVDIRFPSFPAAEAGSNLQRLGQFQGIIQFHSEIANGALQLGMTKKQLTGA